MTLATKLTLSRIIVIPFFILAFCWNKPDAPLTEDWGKVIAFFIFVFASITDYFDGYLARLHKEVTTFGKFIDPIADKILVSAALIVMVQYESITQTSAEHYKLQITVLNGRCLLCFWRSYVEK